jgi:RimJ/RimL family protein N-acetyltransferase
VHADSCELVDVWAADLLGVPQSMLWQPGVTVGMHAGLGDHPGIVVLARKGGVHVSLPEWADKGLIDELVEVPAHDLERPTFWKGYRHTHDLKVTGPLVHTFTDVPVDAPSKVEQIHASDVEHWRDHLSRRKWEESGFGGNVLVAFGLRVGSEIASASNLRAFRGEPADVGLLTHPKYRGKGYSVRVVRAATSYAVRNGGLARFRVPADHDRLRSIAKALDYEDYFTELVIRPRD